MTEPATAEDAGLETIRTWLERTCAIHYPPGKRALLQQRLDRVQQRLGISTLTEMANALRHPDAQEVQLAIMHAASTNHTYFFRETDVLEQFRKDVLPTLATRPEIRLWSAACSTGDEVYTLAILIAEALGPEALRRTHILGTDISAPVIEQAEAGIYPRDRLEQMPADLLERYLRPVGLNRFRINDEIRAACTFRRMNLKKSPYPFQHMFQAVFCRNVLYYFAPADQVEVVNAIADVTERGGWMFTSVTENLRDLSPRWLCISNGISRKTDRLT
jgi:chemotaxis protein methyltransferase CheR